MTNRYGYTSISVYGADFAQLSGRDAGAKLDVLAVQWDGADYETKDKAQRAAWALVKDCKDNRIASRVMNVRISDATKTKLLEVGNGSVSAGVRIVLGLSRDVNVSDAAIRRENWYTLTLRSRLLERAYSVAPGKDVSELIALAMQVWDALPLPIANLLYHKAREEDDHCKDEEGGSGAINAKIEKATVDKLVAIGYSKSEGARIVLRTLCDIIEERLTVSHCETFNHREWFGRRFPRLPGKGAL